MGRGASVALAGKKKKNKKMNSYFMHKREIYVSNEGTNKDKERERERLAHVTNTIDSVIVTRKWPPRRKQMSKSNHSHGNNLNQIGASGAENREHAG